MDVTERAHLLQVLQQRRASVVERWRRAIEHTSFTPRGAAAVEREIDRLVGQVIALLLAEPFEPAGAREIGAALVRLRYVRPEALGKTQDVLTECLLSGLPDKRLLALHPRLTGLLAQIAVGFCDATRSVIYAEQEAIRGALLVERRQAEEALRESEARYRAVVEQAAEGIVLVDAHTKRVSEANAAFQRLLGYSPDELRRLTLCDLIAHDRPSIERNIRQVLSHGQYSVGERRYRRKDGGTVEVDVRASAIALGGRDMLCILVRDISARKRAEAAIRAGEERLRTVVTNVPVVLFTLDRAGVITFIEGRGLAGLGHTPGDLIGRTVFGGGQRAAQVPDNVRRALAGESFHTQVEVGETVFEAHYAPLFEGRDIAGVIGVATDITERVQAAAASRASEARFRAIFQEAAVGITLADLAGRPVESNRALQRMLGYSGDELRGMVFTEFTHPDDVAADLALFGTLVDGRREHYQLKKRYIRRDGTIIWVHLTVSLVRDAQGQPHFTIGMVEDITDRERIAADLLEAQRRLAESREAERLHLARELHDGPIQDLYGVRFQLEGLTAALPDAASRAELAMVQANLEQATGTLRAICGELRPSTLAPFGLATAIRSHVERLLEGYPDLAITLDLQPDGQSLPDEVRLALFRVCQEALRNVVRHARARQVAIRLARDGDLVELAVRDDGISFIVPDRWVMLARRGHLGLLGLAERAGAIGARLEVVSAPGDGTLVRVTVPLAGDGRPAGDNRCPPL